VERWFALLSEKQIKRGAHRSTRALEDAIRQYLALTKVHGRTSPRHLQCRSFCDCVFHLLI
jgi:hypothetical protein